MPELPDIEVFSKNLDNLYSSKKISKARIVNGRKLRDKPSGFTRLKRG